MDEDIDVKVSDGITEGLTFNSYNESKGTYKYDTEIWN